MYMLIDCDNFFVSCEEIFQPHLRLKPVVVLSNNDGCVVSRSSQAKTLGIPMCSPFFKIEHLLKYSQGVALSSNYELYADISHRMINLLNELFAKVEVYSIDEAFIEIDFKDDYLELAQNLRQTIAQQIGIPISIGIAKTKTLCKIASHIAKKSSHICQLLNPEAIQQALQQTPVLDIWGIGKQTSSKLNFLGYFTANDLCHAPLGLIRKNFSITIEKTVMELNEVPCLESINDNAAKSILSTGSFDFEVQKIERLQQILSEFVDCACLRLRQQKARANGIQIELHTNRFNLQMPQYQNYTIISLEQASNNTAKFIQAMLHGLQKIYRPEYWYKRAGIMLMGLEPQDHTQSNWLEDTVQLHKDQRLMQAFDNINHKLGRKSIYFGSSATAVKSHLKREFKSHQYTTSWQELLLVE